VRMRVSDNSVLAMIRSWLNAPIIETDENGKEQPPSKPNGKGTPQGGVISPMLANIYLHWFDKMFHRADAPYTWANARLVRYADDFVILAKYQGYRIDEWVKQTLEGRFGLEINKEKTKIVRLDKGESLDFLGYTFRYDQDLYRQDKKYLNIIPSKKSMKKAREALREKTSASKCYKPTDKVIEDINNYLTGWSNYFKIGYPRKAHRDISHYARLRVIAHLNRRSQRKYHRLKGVTHYEHLQKLGLINL
jgi:RNA-directed DNA polymerase